MQSLVLSGAEASLDLENRCVHWHNIYQNLYRRAISLGVVSVGDNPASQVYIERKRRMALKLGFVFEHYHFSAQASSEEIVHCIRTQAEQLSGMILQLPLPLEHDSRLYASTIPPEKDVDGLHPLFRSPFVPCTALGCLALLQYYKIPIQGRSCLVIGRSSLVGRPLAKLLLDHNATVTIAHSKTTDLSEHTLKSDIICVAAGVPHLLKAHHVSAKATVVDVGIHRTSEGLAGDVDPEVYAKVSAYSPVPGGVGPMTVISLMWNTLCAAFLVQGQYWDGQSF